MKLTINLLTPARRRRQLMRRRAMQWSAILGTVLFAVFVGRWFESREYGVLRRQLEAALREGRPAQIMIREIATMRQQIDNLQDYEAIAQELEHRRLVLPVLGLVSRSAKLSHGKLRVLEVRCEDLQSLDVPGDTAHDKARPGTITLVGVAIDSPAVAEFEGALLQSAMFADVRLVKTNEQKVGTYALCDYELVCEL